MQHSYFWRGFRGQATGSIQGSSVELYRFFNDFSNAKEIHTMMKQTRKITITLILLSAVVLLAGCATSQGLNQQGEVKLENVDSKMAHITNTYLRSTKDGIVLHGELTRRIPARGHIPGHLHVELIGPDGKVIKEVDIGYTRRSTNARYARFSVPVPGPLIPGSIIRVTHHKTHLPDSSGPTWRDVNAVELN